MWEAIFCSLCVLSIALCLACAHAENRRLRAENERLKRAQSDTFGPAGFKHVHEVLDENERLKAVFDNANNRSIVLAGQAMAAEKERDELRAALETVKRWLERIKSGETEHGTILTVGDCERIARQALALMENK